MSGTDGQPFDAIVIGSGFGGAVATCRLAQAGLRVCLLERGRRFAAGDFPRPPMPSAYPDERSGAGLAWAVDRGLYDIRSLGAMQVVQAAGYGGGSLVYASVHMRAPPDAFEARGEDPGWPTDGPDAITHDTLDGWYRLAAHMLDVRPAPAAWSKSKHLSAWAEAEGRGGHVFRPNLAVNFEGSATVEIHDPGEASAPPGRSHGFVSGRVNAQGRPQGRCVGCGHCDLGCRYHAKNTLDLNYLAAAADAGATIRTEAEVTGVARGDDARYEVTWTDHRFARARRASADAVFVCAGAVNTTELLLRSWTDLTGEAPDAERPDHPGGSFGGNGDSIGVVFDTDEPVDAGLGPTITTALLYHRPPAERGDLDAGWLLVQDGGLPAALLPLLDLLGYRLPRADGAPLDGLGWLRALVEPLSAGVQSTLPSTVRDLRARMDRERVAWTKRGAVLATDSLVARRGWLEPGRFAVDWLARESLAGLTAPDRIGALVGSLLGGFDGAADRRAILLAMGRDRADLRLELDERGHLVAHGRAYDDHRVYQLEERLMNDLARAAGGALRVNPLWGMLRRPITVHPHGGCPMGSALSAEVRAGATPDGVVDRYGEAYAAPGLYVLDAAAFPAAIGANPSATILALAERNIERFIRRVGVTRGDALADWRAPVYAAAQREAPDEPLFEIERRLPPEGSAPPTHDPIGIAFTERLEGYFAPADAPNRAAFAADPPVDACLDAERRGLAGGATHRIGLALDCTTRDLEAMLASRAHSMSVTGWAEVGDERYAVTGAMSVLVPIDASTRALVYDLRYETPDGEHTLYGRKVIRDDPGLDAIVDLSTAFCVRRTPRGAELGVLRVHLSDFIDTQLPSIRVIGGAPQETGAPDDARLVVDAWYLSRFARFFLGGVLQVYGGRLGEALAAGGAGLVGLMHPGGRRPTHGPGSERTR